VKSDNIKLTLRATLQIGVVGARRRVTEQVNVVTIFLTVVFSAICYGWIEGTLYPYYPYKDQLVIANHFTWYHLVFLTLFLIIGFSLSLSRTLYTGLRKYYLLFASAGSVVWGFWIEDMSYFSTRYPAEILAPGVWVEWGLSGFYCFGLWIPWMYVFLCSGGFSLFGFAFMVAKRDAVAYRMKALQPPRKQIGKLLSSHALLIIVGAIVVELSNLLAVRLTNLELPLSVTTRLLSILTVVVVIPLLLLTISDSISKMDF
jgi:hypothetical protein